MAKRTDPPDPIIMETSGIVVDPEGVPYIDQSDAAHRKTGVRNRNKRSPEQLRKFHTRIEHVRSLLAIMMSDRDIRHVCAASWGISKGHVQKYIRLARGRNNELLARSPDEMAADSRKFWIQELIDYRTMMQTGSKDLKEYQKQRSDGQKLLEEAGVQKSRAETAEEHMAANELMTTASRIIGAAVEGIDLAHRQIEKGRNGAQAVMDRIDKSFGTHQHRPDGERPNNPGNTLIQNNKSLNITVIGTDGQPRRIPMTMEALDAELAKWNEVVDPDMPEIVRGVIDVDPQQTAIEQERAARGKNLH